MIHTEELKKVVEKYIMTCSIDYADYLVKAPFMPDSIREEFKGRIHKQISSDLAIGIIRYLADNSDQVVSDDEKNGLIQARAVVLTEGAFWALITELLDMVKDQAVKFMELNPPRIFVEKRGVKDGS